MKLNWNEIKIKLIDIILVFNLWYRKILSEFKKKTKRESSMRLIPI